MKVSEFLARVERLGFKPHGAHELLGVARSTVFRIASGATKVPLTVERLIEMYERYGIPDDHMPPDRRASKPGAKMNMAEPGADP
ncbi:MAG TPA: hypothetical protein VHT00_14155 [Stellaceae bacterium]|jgi:hypothetical protein|nr:hypothetical protein [Stellaceae bacterium]